MLQNAGIGEEGLFYCVYHVGTLLECVSLEDVAVIGVM